MTKPKFEVHFSLVDDNRLNIDVEIEEIDFEDIIINFLHVSDTVSQAVETPHKVFLRRCANLVDAFEEEKEVIIKKRSDIN